MKVEAPAGKNKFSVYAKGLARLIEEHRNFFMRVYIERNRRGWSRADFVRMIQQHGSTLSSHYFQSMERFSSETSMAHRAVIYHMIAVFLDQETSDMFKPITYEEQVEYNKYFEINSNKTKVLNMHTNAA